MNGDEEAQLEVYGREVIPALAEAGDLDWSYGQAGRRDPRERMMSAPPGRPARRVAEAGGCNPGGPMIGRLTRSRDPWWDDGTGARQIQRRRQVEGFFAFAMAVVACGLTVAMWLRAAVPFMDRNRPQLTALPPA